MSALKLNYSLSNNHLLLFVCIYSLNLFFWLGWRSSPQIANENQLMECLQSLILGIACAMFVVRAKHSQFATINWMLHIGFALLMYSFVLREVDIDEFGSSAYWAHLERALRIGGVIGWAVLACLMAYRFQVLYANKLAIIKAPLTMLTLAGGVLLIAGWPFDKAVFEQLSPRANEFGEEIFELNGYLLMMFAALSPALTNRSR
jgi:uncharacterized membrane protein